MEEEKTLPTMWKTEPFLKELSEGALDELAKEYVDQRIPWDHLHKHNVFKHARDHRMLSTPQPGDVEFEFRNAIEIVDSFFHKGKPIVEWILEYVDYWIFYLVTEGRIRSDINKKTRVFKKSRGNIPLLAWATILKTSDRKDWELVENDKTYNLITTATDLCNAVLTGLRRKIRGYKMNTVYVKNSYKNLNQHPEFVPFQQNRGNHHKQFLYRYAQRNKGGNAGKHEAHAPEILSKQSIHYMMRELHEWLPAMRKR